MVFVVSSPSVATWPFDSSSVSTTPDVQEVVDRLMSLFEGEPLESGVEHAAESVLAHLVRTAPTIAMDVATRILADSEELVAPQLIRCVGRLVSARAEAVFMPMVKDALKSSEISMRDAAVRALEGWGTPGAVHALAGYEEPVPWLRDYAVRVLRDLCAKSSSRLGLRYRRVSPPTRFRRSCSRSAPT